jgi:hypothetical protein
MARQATFGITRMTAMGSRFAQTTETQTAGGEGGSSRRQAALFVARAAWPDVWTVVLKRETRP